jgi:hypothetical protein
VSVALAGGANAEFDAVGLADAVPLQDMQMSELRGTGLLSSFIQNLLAALPPGNTVSAKLNQQAEVTLNGTGPQSLSCGNGITCPAGTTVNLFANNNAPSGSVSVVHLSISH